MMTEAAHWRHPSPRGGQGARRAVEGDAARTAPAITRRCISSPPWGSLPPHPNPLPRWGRGSRKATPAAKHAGRSSDGMDANAIPPPTDETRCFVESYLNFCSSIHSRSDSLLCSLSSLAIIARRSSQAKRSINFNSDSRMAVFPPCERPERCP